MIASEVALFLYDSNRRFSVQQYLGQHSLSNLEWAILNYRWSNELKDSAERVKNDILFLFTTLKERLPDLLGEQASDFYEDLNEDQKKQLVENIIGQGLDISELGKMKANGKYLRYIDIDTLVDIFRREPGYFFDGNFWKETYNAITGLSANLIEQAQLRTRSTYLNCLEDIARFLKYAEPETIITQRARASLEILQQRMV